MKLTTTDIPDVLLVEPAVFADERGWFMESWNAQRFQAALRQHGQKDGPAELSFVQDNHSCSRRGVLRGLHYQLPPHAQGKLVRVVVGAAFDVAVDIRRGSPSYGRWVGATLSAENRRQLWIPPGFAHGFLALEDDTHFLYKTTAPYDKASERCIRWDDPRIGIAWPLPGGQAPELSDKDLAAPGLDEAETF